MINNWSKIELLAKFRDIHRSNPGVTFQITTRGNSAMPNRLNRYVRDAGSVSMNSKGIRLSAGNDSGFETINYAEMMGVSYTLPNNTHHRLY
ncbi:MAG TPA: hypothetical protein DEQ38_05970 [Elusimicrobia bacterium]|nr:MAG: hypothetical protein A2089_13855 [Elusimicrobia bacterium GWD2_63_28]HCC47648.1 hypothetical protein [Elusimicrobiota bacterium]